MATQPPTVANRSRADSASCRRLPWGPLSDLRGIGPDLFRSGRLPSNRESCLVVGDHFRAVSHALGLRTARWAKHRGGTRVEYQRQTIARRQRHPRRRHRRIGRGVFTLESCKHSSTLMHTKPAADSSALAARFLASGRRLGPGAASPSIRSSRRHPHRLAVQRSTFPFRLSACAYVLTIGWLEGSAVGPR